MSTRRVDAELAQQCALIGQQVQQRAFGGDFDKMIAGWQREREAARAALPEGCGMKTALGWPVGMVGLLWR